MCVGVGARIYIITRDIYNNMPTPTRVYIFSCIYWQVAEYSDLVS